MPQPRPASVTLLLWTVLMLTAYGALRFIAALRWWNVLDEFGARLSPIYLSIGGAVWVIAGGVLFWGIVARKPWSRFALLASVVLWYVQYWVERIFFEAARTNTGFILLVTTLLAIVVIISLYLPSARKYFLKSEEHEQADTHSTTA